ncbi:MAG: hypothetical protein LBC67_05075 [Spirochaetales bacterium]|nr:hypothetical protein [Spirochaetales bacterium]
MKKMICYLNNLAGKVSNIAACAGAAAAVTAAFLAVYIPRRILINQLYADMVSQYRSPQMGYAVFSLFAFYHYDCRGQQALIKEKYIERYKAEIYNELHKPQRERICAPEAALHFQRRLVAYFYWDLAKLCLEARFPGLSKKHVRQFITPSERNVMSLVLHTSEAAAACFLPCDTLADPPEDEAAMNQLIQQLYEKTEDLT